MPRPRQACATAAMLLLLGAAVRCADVWPASVPAGAAGPATAAAEPTRGAVRALPVQPAPVASACTGGPGAPPADPAPADEDLQVAPDSLRALLARHRNRRPDLAELVEIGTTRQGRPLLALALGRGCRRDRAGAAILLDGSHHGDEPLATAIVLDAARYLLERQGRDARVDRWLQELTFWLVPLVNPDGWQARLRFGRGGRKNGRDHDGDGRLWLSEGVDLNRNYPFRWGALGQAGSSSRPAHRSYRGPAPASEPETRALMRLAEAEHFVGAITYHVGAVALLVPYTIDFARSPEPNEAWSVASWIAARMPRHPDAAPGIGFPVRRKLYAVDGTSQDWLRFAHGTAAFLIEAGLRPAGNPAARARRIVRSVRPSWMLLAERFLSGPSIDGYVSDAAGRPVSAEVEILETELREGELWRSRCRDGYYARYLPGPGRYTLRVSAPGLAPVERPVAVGTERARLDIALGVVVAPALACLDGVEPSAG
ncbi:MAG: hypothetical protein HY744_11630 [Deltaproteobacteria bacterium]|nr:hypothetical protein [Deltaproteobacteria bacterium]